MDYKGLLRQIEITMREIESSEETASTISNVARTIIKNFRDQLGLSGGRLYALRDDQYELIQRVGTSSQNELGIQVPADYAPIAAAIENRVILMEPNDPGVDRILRAAVRHDFPVNLSCAGNQTRTRTDYKCSGGSCGSRAAPLRPEAALGRAPHPRGGARPAAAPCVGRPSGIASRRRSAEGRAGGGLGGR